MLVVFLSRWFATANPSSLARWVKWGIIAAGAAATIFLGVTGKAHLAFLPLALTGLPWLLGRMAQGRMNPNPTAGQRSDVETPYLRMTLDHDSGEMEGTVLQGRHTGRRLDELSERELLDLWDECSLRDEEGRRLLEAYLDRILGPDWRERVEEEAERERSAGAGTGQGWGRKRQNARRRPHADDPRGGIRDSRPPARRGRRRDQGRRTARSCASSTPITAAPTTSRPRSTRRRSCCSAAEAPAMRQPVRKAVLPVAGMATRFLPASKAVPKAMLPVVDKPLIQYAVEEAQAAGIEQFIFVTGRGEAAIAAHFGPDEALDAYLAARHDETARALVAGCRAATWRRCVHATGAGAGPWPCRPLRPAAGRRRAVRGAACRRAAPGRSALSGRARRGPRAHGGQRGGTQPRCRRPRPAATAWPRSRPTTGAPSRSPAWWEKPANAPSRLALIGRYVLQPAVFSRLAAQPPGAGGEIQLTDALAAMAREAPFHGVRFAGQRFDCGSPAGYLQATVACALERPELRQDLLSFLRGIAASP